MKAETTLAVVGLKHHMTDFTLKELEKQLPLRAKIKREPQNEFDENAMAVYVFSKNLDRRGYKIGYIRRQVARELAPEIDNGSLAISKVTLTEIYTDEWEAEVEIGLNKGKIAP